MDAWTFDAIGTAWQIDTRHRLADDVRSEIAGRIESFDATWSRFRPDSLVTQMAERAGTWPLPGEADELLGFYAELHDLTGGAVDPLVGQTLVDLGYDAAYSLVPAEIPQPAVSWWAYAPDLTLTSDGPEEQRTLTTAAPALLDVGAAGKGLLVDLVSDIVGRQTHHFTVDASGDIYHGGTAPIRVALEHPADPTRAIGVVELDREDALCASATNRRTWGDGLHHVLDARTGRPTRDVVATWVLVAQSCMRADGLATAHFFADDEVTDRLQRRFDHHFVRMHADGRVEWSPDFPGEIFR